MVLYLLILPIENQGFAPPKTTKMTKMVGITQAKAWFRKSRVCFSLNYRSSKWHDRENISELIGL